MNTRRTLTLFLALALPALVLLAFSAPTARAADPVILRITTAGRTTWPCGGQASWSNPCGFDTAPSNPLSGSELWVATGTYTPTTGTDRTATFRLRDGVARYGGFAGGETLRARSNSVANVTILSGVSYSAGGTLLPLTQTVNGLATIEGHVTYLGLPIGGINLILRWYLGTGFYTEVMTTTTQVDGTYQFTGVQPPPTDYEVSYRNGADGNSSNPSYLSFWHSYEISPFNWEGSIAGGDFDIADIPLVSPSNGSIIGLPPSTFEWSKRNAAPSDSYEISLYDRRYINPVWESPHLGYIGTFTLSSLPSAILPNREYSWHIRVYAPDGGYGEAHDSRSVTFTDWSASSIFVPFICLPESTTPASTLP